MRIRHVGTVLITAAAACGGTGPVEHATPSGPTLGVEVYGGIAWRVATAGPIRGGALRDGERIVFGSADGVLRAVSAARGDSVWARDLGAPINSTPARVGNVIVVTAQDGAVIGVDAATGVERWRWRFGATRPLAWAWANGDYWSASPVPAGSDRVVVAGQDGTVALLSAKNGKVRWRATHEGRVRATPLVVGDTVISAGFDGIVSAWALRDGHRLWRFATEGAALRSETFGFDRRSIQSGPVASDGQLFVGARDGYLYALDLHTGAQRWRVGYDMSWIISTPAVRDGLVIVGTSDGHFVNALDVRDGKERWRFATDNSVWSSAALGAHVGAIGDGSGSVTGFDVATGQVRWRYRTAGSVLATPLVTDSLVVVGSGDGSLYAFANGAATLRRVLVVDSVTAGRAAFVAALSARGYEVRPATNLSARLDSLVQAGGRTALIVAADRAADALPVDQRPSWRRFLTTGGVMTWIGMPPGIWPNGADGQRSYPTIDRAATTALVGVPHDSANFDLFATRPTADGRRFGLRATGTDRWSVPAVDGLLVLLADERGRASAWYHRGGAGTGFLRLPQDFGAEARVADLVALAESRFP